MPYQFRRHPRLQLSLRIGFVLLIGAFVLLRAWQQFGGEVEPEVLEPGPYRVERVIDGDTLLLANKARIRLIGADTPETVHPNRPKEPFGEEAAALTRRLVQGKKVWLEFDRERKDRYGRFLAYVYLEAPLQQPQRRMLNEELIRVGLARARLRYRYSAAMKRRFKRAESEAKSAQKNIWSP